MKKSIIMLDYKDVLIDICPKSGTNSILQTFLGNKFKSGSHKREGTYWNYFRNNMVTNPTNKYKIKIIRNPKDRALSVYLHYIRSTKSKDSFYIFLQKLNDFHSNSDILVNSTSVYEENLPFINDKFGNIEFEIFEMLCLQANFDQVKFDLTWRLERMNGLVSFLNREFNYKLKSCNKKLNKQTNKKPKFNYFKDQNLNLIRKIYSEDFDLYFSNNIGNNKKNE